MPVLADGKQMIVDTQLRCAVENSLAPKSSDGFSGMWQPLQLASAFWG